MSDYERLERLGAGNFGEVWLVYDRALGVQRAVKYVPKDRIGDPTTFYNEPQTLMALRHEHIVRVEDAGRTEEGTLFVAMEYLARGSIDDVWKGRPVPMSKAFAILQDICWAIEYAHQKDYVHRDIKPGNILLGPKGRAKLSDFGLATRVPRGATASPYGYLTHLAPEVLSGGRTSRSSDIYALGVTAYRLINGDGFLPEATDMSEIQDMILTGDYPDRKHYRPHVPRRVQTIVNRCMAFDPKGRFACAADFRQALEGIELHCDWKVKRKRDVVRYLAKFGSCTVTVTISPESKEHFAIETLRLPEGGKVRRVLSDCYSGLSRTEMKKRVRQILPRYVMEGK